MDLANFHTDYSKRPLQLPVGAVTFCLREIWHFKNTRIPVKKQTLEDVKWGDGQIAVLIDTPEVFTNLRVWFPKDRIVTQYQFIVVKTFFVSNFTKNNF